MKIEINTDTDSYELWKKIEELVESIYIEPVHVLESKPGGKAPGTTSSRYNIFKKILYGWSAT